MIDKVVYEGDAFLAFLRVVGIDCDDGSIEQLSPPEPDVLCTVGGAKRYFELVRLTDPGIERNVLTGKSGYSNFSMGPTELALIVEKKAGKSYRVDAPVDLVVHEGAIPIDGLWVHAEEDRLRQVMREMAEGSAFARIWLVDFSSNRFIVEEISSPIAAGT